MKNFRLIALACAGGLALPLTGEAQVVREEGAKSIAGVLTASTGTGTPASAAWTFSSFGGEILFATLDADIYRRMTEHDGHTAAAVVPGEDEHEGGPGLFRLSVSNATGVLPGCTASRPTPPPGWQRDPRMACVIPATRTPVNYTIEVRLVIPDGEIVQASYPFLLNVSLRRIAPTGTNLHSAAAISSAGGF